MNFPSNPNPNPNFSDFDENLVVDLDFADVFLMFDEDLNPDDSSSSTWSINSSEKVAAEGTSPPVILSTSSVNGEIREKDETRRMKLEGAPIHVFRTKSTIEVLDDGYKWRKYGKKPIRGSPYPRHYHKCSNPDCGVKKKIERDTADPEYVLTTYEGRHNHGSPSVIYCDSDDLDFMSQNVWCFQNTSNHSRSAP